MGNMPLSHFRIGDILWFWNRRIVSNRIGQVVVQVLGKNKIGNKQKAKASFFTKPRL
jgi:hypothetical protein